MAAESCTSEGSTAGFCAADASRTPPRGHTRHSMSGAQRQHWPKAWAALRLQFSGQEATSPLVRWLSESCLQPRRLCAGELTLLLFLPYFPQSTV